MNSTCSCGCCEGITVSVPQSTFNRPGLPALAYRIGTHATFLETMLARLSSHEFPALAVLKTRDPADPAIALLDSWALVADVLSFYQERIANEGYLRTATERRSVLELARLIGYRFRPGVAATVYLAYTLEVDRSKTPPLPTWTTIPAGSRCQSVPESGQLPQSFETSAELEARSSWNNLQPRLTQPPLFTLNDDPETDAALRSRIYFKGITTQLNPGDPLILVLSQNIDPRRPEQFLRAVRSVEPDSERDLTLVTLQSRTVRRIGRGETALSIVTTGVTPFINDTTPPAQRTALATQVRALLSNTAPRSPAGLLEKLSASADKSGATAARLVRRTSEQVARLHDLAVERTFTRLEPWIAQLMEVLNSLVPELQKLDTDELTDSSRRSEFPEDGQLPPLASLTALLPALTTPSSPQPRNASSLGRSVNSAFSSRSDMAVRLLGAFSPAAAPILSRAWANIESPPNSTQVGAARIKAGLFAGTYPGLPTSVTNTDRVTTTTFNNPPNVNNAWSGILLEGTERNELRAIALDAVYDKIMAGSWIMIDRPALVRLDDDRTGARRIRTFHTVVSVTSASMTTDDGGFSSKATQLTIDPPWLMDTDAGALRTRSELLRETIVYAQTELLELADEPIEDDVSGATVELDRVYDGLESGRWAIVSGERTDIPNVTGITASELVMLQGVEQDTFVNGTRDGPIHTVIHLATPLAYSYKRTSVVIHGNVVGATHGETRRETLGNGDASQSFQEFALKQKPLTFVPAANPTGVDSTLEVYVNNLQWHETDNLAGIGPRERSFVVKSGNDDAISVTFGNGHEGARLPTGVGNVAAVYRNGIGQSGNVAAGQISLLQSRPLNVKEVINPLRASGGANRDTRDQARRKAPLAVLALDRLVSVRDYADFARTFAGIGKATATRLSDGQRGVVFVTIAGADDIPIDRTSGLWMNLLEALKKYGDPHLPVQLAVRRLRLLVISANIKIHPDHLWEPVAAAIRTSLNTALSFDQRDLGQPVFQSEVIALIQAVEGVAYVDLQILDCVPETITAAQLVALASSLKLNPMVDANLAEPNPSPANYPDDVNLPAELLYLSSALPDTLILNEVKP